VIKSKHFDTLVIVLLIAAVVFTAVGGYYASATASSSGSSSSSTTSKYATTIFDKDKVMEVNIQMSDSDWNTLIDNATSEEYQACDITINGTTYKNVGIRCKGNTSLTQVAQDDTTDRFSFKIKFDEYVDGQTADGLDELALNNIYADATYMKEYLSYDLMSEMGVDTPLFSYSHITRNGAEWGLYLAVECINTSFATRNYGTNHGNLYKVENSMEGGGQGGQNAGAANGGNNNTTNNTNNTNNTGGNTNSTDNTNGGTTGGGNTGQNGGSPPQMSGGTDGSGGGSGGPGGGQMPQMSGDTGGLGQMPQPSGDANGNGQAPSMPSGMNGQAPGNGGGGGMDTSDTSGTNFVYTDDSIDSYSGILDNAVDKVSDADKEKVISAIKTLNTGSSLDSAVDVSQTLKYFAVNAFLVNGDDYMGSLCHNFYIYEKNGVLTTIPWDYNLAFGGFQSSDATSSVNTAIDYSSSNLSSRPLLGKLLSNSSYLSEYHSYLQQIVTSYIDSGKFKNTISKVDNLISSYVKKDASAFYTYDEYKTAVDNLKAYGTLRGDSVQKQLSGTIASSTDNRTDSSTLVDASGVNLTAMGTMNNQKNGNTAAGGNTNGQAAGGNTTDNNTNNSNNNNSQSTTNGDQKQQAVAPGNNAQGGQSATTNSSSSGKVSRKNGSTTALTTKNYIELGVLFGGMVVLTLYLKFRRRRRI